MKLVLNIATVDSEVDPGNYPAGDYSLNLINQKRFDPLPQQRFVIAPQWIRSSSIGLSNSRNEGLRAVTDSGAVLLLGDNDVRYLPGFDERIRLAYAQYPDADVILFKVCTPEGREFKAYPRNATSYGMRDIMRACSIEISFRVAAVVAAGIRFDERFGLGARLETGEDIIFLADCLRAGLTIMFVPASICVHPVESSGSAHSERLFYAKGAMFRRIFGAFGIFAAVAYGLKKARSRKTPALIDAILACCSGAVRS
jgi:hypothetical protein